MSTATVTFQMKNGSVLKCEYEYRYYPATYWEPADCDVGEPTYFINDEEVTFYSLPKGLDVLANAMYENQDDPRFKYSSTDDTYDGDDYGFE